MAYKITLFDTEYDCIGTGCMSLDYIAYQLQCAGGQDIEIDISSGGGSAFDAVAIYNLLKSYSGKITTNNISLAGSAAATVFAAGSIRRMSKYALLMIHPAQVGSFGDANDLAADAEMIQKVTDNVISIWTDVTGQPIEKITELVNATTWLKSEDAISMGFATEIYDTGDNSLEDLGILNGMVIMNQVKKAPSKYQQVINKILTKTPAPAPIQNQMTKEEIEALVNPNNSLLKKVLNVLKFSSNKITTNKGEMYVVGNLVVGSPVFNDGDMDSEAEDAAEVVVTNAEGKSITMSIAGGRISNVINAKTDDDMADGDDDDMEADNKVVLNHAGINFKKVNNVVDHKAIKNAMAKKLGEVTNVVNQQNSLIVELREQLTASNEAVQRTELEVRNQIITEFAPKTSNRQSRQGEAEKENPFKPKENSYAANAAKAALNKIK